MNKDQVHSILEKIRKGNSTREERNLLVQWYEAAIDADADELFNEVGDIIDKMDISSLKELEMQLSEPGKPKMTAILNRWRLVGVAAAVAVLIFSTIAGFRYFRKGEPAMMVYSTGKGEIREIHLPDGSEVTLNAVSVLTVPESFESGERKVLLKGEAFFSVAKSENLPFSVATDDSLMVKVLGTSFNISAYGSNMETAVAVSTGKVTVSKAGRHFGVLTAGQQLAYNKGSRLFSRTSDRNAAVWLKGIVAFRGNTLQEVAETLYRMYGKQVLLQPGVDGELQFTGNFEKAQGVDNILQIVCSLHHLEYAYKGNQIVISRKPF